MPKLKTDHLFIFSCSVLIFGILWSRFMISLGMIFLLSTAIYSGSFLQNAKAFVKNKYYLAVTGIFFIFLISGLWTQNTDYFIQRMTIKLPFLFLPFSFFAIPKVEKKTIVSVFYIFIAVCLSGVLYSIGYFVTDLDYYIKLYSQGQILPTPVHHIRFSIMLSVAVAMAIYLVIQKVYLKKPTERYFLIGIIIFFVLYLHILAVRSGLMTLYVLLLYTVFYLLKNNINKKMGIALFSFSALVVALSFMFVPTVKNKVGYMKYSLQQFAKNENIRDLSDSRRLGSIYGGLHLANQHPIIGVGYGDLKDETNNYLKENYPDLKNLDLLPHNQYILALATAGLIGLIAFLFCTFYPFFYLSAHKNFFFVSTQLMFISSFIVEHTIEAQIGTAIYIFIVLLSMKNLETYSIDSTFDNKTKVA